MVYLFCEYGNRSVALSGYRVLCPARKPGRKAVQIRCGSATVSGDENRNSHWMIFIWEGAVSRQIHEPGYYA
jgi:hypothetical protein